jgi:hypothetical protein
LMAYPGLLLPLRSTRAIIKFDTDSEDLQVAPLLYK